MKKTHFFVFLVAVFFLVSLLHLASSWMTYPAPILAQPECITSVASDASSAIIDFTGTSSKDIYVLLLATNPDNPCWVAAHSCDDPLLSGQSCMQCVKCPPPGKTAQQFCEEWCKLNRLQTCGWGSSDVALCVEGTN